MQTLIDPLILFFNFSDSPHKIFIGGLPNYLNEEQVRAAYNILSAIYRILFPVFNLHFPRFSQLSVKVRLR